MCLLLTKRVAIKRINDLEVNWTINGYVLLLWWHNVGNNSIKINRDYYIKKRKRHILVLLLDAHAYRFKYCDIRPGIKSNRTNCQTNFSWSLCPQIIFAICPQYLCKISCIYFIDIFLWMKISAWNIAVDYEYVNCFE